MDGGDHKTEQAGTRRKRRRTSPLWTQEAWTRVAALEGRLEHVENEIKCAAIQTKICLARAILDDPVPRGWGSRFLNWWNGALIELTWTWLEQAEIDIVQHSNSNGLEISLIIARQRAERSLGRNDAHRQALTKLATVDEPAKGEER